MAAAFEAPPRYPSYKFRRRARALRTRRGVFGGSTGGACPARGLAATRYDLVFRTGCTDDVYLFAELPCAGDV